MRRIFAYLAVAVFFLGCADKHEGARHSGVWGNALALHAGRTKFFLENCGHRRSSDLPSGRASAIWQGGFSARKLFGRALGSG